MQGLHPAKQPKVFSPFPGIFLALFSSFFFFFGKSQNISEFFSDSLILSKYSTFFLENIYPFLASLGKDLGSFSEDLHSGSLRSQRILSPSPFYWQIANKSFQKILQNVSKTGSVFRKASKLTPYSTIGRRLKAVFFRICRRLQIGLLLGAKPGAGRPAGRAKILLTI